MEVQNFLNVIFEKKVINVSGVFDAITSGFVTIYQKTRDIPVTGLVDHATYFVMKRDSETSCSVQFVESDKEVYTLGETVRAYAAGLVPNTIVDIYITNASPNPRPDKSSLMNWDEEGCEGLVDSLDFIDVGVGVDFLGSFNEPVWNIPMNSSCCGQYDIIVDTNGERIFNSYIDKANRDPIDKVNSTGFVVLCSENASLIE
jgi:hypothetical protein